MPLKKSGLLMISAACQPGRADEVEAAIRDEIERIKEDASDAAEIDRAKRMVLASSIFDRETFEARAAYISLCSALASPEFDREYLESIEQVTPDRLNEAAHKYLDFDRVVSGRVVPRRSGSTVIAATAGSTENEWSVAVPELAAGKPRAWDEDGDVKKTRLDNGSVLLHRENGKLPIVACEVLFHAGSTRETDFQGGLASMTQKLMLKGAAGRSLQQTSFLLESLGIDMGGRADLDEAGMGFECLPDEFDTALVLLRDAIASPNFDAAEMERTRREMITHVRREKDSMSSYLSRVGAKALWGDHPYGRMPSGEEESLAHISLQDVRRFHAGHYGPDDMVLSVAGAIGHDEAAAKVESAFGKLPSTESPAVALPDYVPIESPITVEEKKPWPAAAVVLAWRVPSITSEDLLPLQILSTAMGNPFGPRIWRTIREERGLAYTTGATYFPRILGGAFVLHAGVAARNIPLVSDLLLREVKKVRSLPITEEELRDSKTFLSGSYKRSRQSSAHIAEHLAFYESCGLGFEFADRYVDSLMGVSADDAMSAACRHLNEKNFLSLSIRPAGGALGAIWRIFRNRFFS